MMETILETRGLEKRFGGVQATAGVDFRLERGELRCVIGPNGAGKSTFFKMLSGQLRPTGGQILFEGKDITHASRHEIVRHGIGIKNQVPDVYDGMSVYENVLIAARFNHGKSAARRKTESMLETVELAAHGDAQVGELAHGLRQRVEFAMVMAMEPKLILLDEPTAGMSAEETNRTAALIREANKQTTVIVIEHDMQFIRQIASIVTVLHQGRILIEDTMSGIQQDPRVRDIYLGRASNA